MPGVILFSMDHIQEDEHNWRPFPDLSSECRELLGRQNRTAEVQKKQETPSFYIAWNNSQGKNPKPEPGIEPGIHWSFFFFEEPSSTPGLPRA